MNSNTLRQFRLDVYKSFQHGKDALFNTVDTLIAETQARSFPELSQSVWFDCKWSSVYKAFEKGRIDEERLREIFARYLPETGTWLWEGIDATSIACPDAETSADRIAQQVHNLPQCHHLLAFSWQFSTMVVLAETESHRTYILDKQRVGSKMTAIEVAKAQLRLLVSHLLSNSMLVLDCGYDAN